MERVFLLGILLLLVACQKSPSPVTPPSESTPVESPADSPSASPPSPSPSPQAPATPAVDPEMIKAGKTAFTVNCTQCHSKDPTKDGPLGPAIAGSSLELLESRIMRLEYPPGYKPKRMTKKMLKMPHLKSKIPALHAYLNSL